MKGQPIQANQRTFFFPVINLKHDIGNNERIAKILQTLINLTQFNETFSEKNVGWPLSLTFRTEH